MNNNNNKCKGERIAFGGNVNFIFETHDLHYASPATVSRMGMIFLSKEAINFKALLSHLVKKHIPEDRALLISNHVEKYLFPFLDWYFNNIEEDLQVTSTTRVGVVLNVFSLIKSAVDTQSFLIGMCQGFSINHFGPVRA